MCLETADITYKETGSELLALLFESSEIKRNYPKYNRAQRRTKESIALFSYEDRSGITHLAWNNLKLVANPLAKFYTISEVRNFVERLCENFELCPKYCHLQTNVSSCFHYQLKKCKGICREKETISAYNARAKQAIDSVRFTTDNFIIKQPGLSANEFGYALVLNGFYRGFGYMKQSTKTVTTSDYLAVLTPQKDTRDIHRILKSYLRKNNDTMVKLPAFQEPGTLF